VGSRQAEGTPTDVEEDRCDIAHSLGKFVEPVSERVEALCEPPPDLCKLVQDRWLAGRRPGPKRARRGAVKQSPARFTLAEVACEDTLDWSEAVAVLGQDASAMLRARTEPRTLSQVLCTRIEVTARFDGDLYQSVADPYA
jgi:hypothetical protein